VRSRIAVWTFIGTTGLLALSIGARRAVDDPIGLMAEHYANAGFLRPAVHSAVEKEVTADGLVRAWNGAPPENLSATWSGWIYIARAGSYTFATQSDQRSWILVDGETILDNIAGPEAQLKQATRRLSRGLHWLVVRYQQTSDHRTLRLLWDPDESGELAPVPAWRLRPERTATWRVLWARSVEVAAPVVRWTWAASLVALVLWLLRPAWTIVRTELVTHGAGKAFAGVIAASFLLNIVGIWWGMPSSQGWAPDEALPQAVLEGIDRRFSNGWYSTYPPFHFYLLAVAYIPVLSLDWLRDIPLDSSSRHVALFISGRLVSVLMAAGTLVAVFLTAAELFGRRAGLFAAIVLALTTPFVFYAKTANVDLPYVFWFAVSLMFYVRLLNTLRLRDFVGFAVAATLAISTKDQAYALYVLTPIPILFRLFEERAPVSRWRALVDSRVLVAISAAVATFIVVNNLLFNWSGYIAHVRTTTEWSQYAPMFDASILGRVSLTWLAARQVAESLGWASAAAAAGGLFLASRQHLQAALCLLVPVVSYWLLFLNVIRYSFDRFLMPICVVAAVLAGFGLARLTATGAWSASRRSLAAAALVFSLAYTVPLDTMIVFDARYAAERWIAEQLSPGESVGTLGLNYLPRFPRGTYQGIVALSDLRRQKPTYLVVNADYLRLRPRVTTEREVLAAVDAGELGYKLAFTSRSSVPWAWLPGMNPVLLGSRTGPVLSNLHHVNPRMEIFRREATEE
jgi:hypothetical protein